MTDARADFLEAVHAATHELFRSEYPRCGHDGRSAPAGRNTAPRAVWPHWGLCPGCLLPETEET